MSLGILDTVARDAGGRIVAALAARFRDLDLAEESYAEACARAVSAWREHGAPADAAAWLYRVAQRAALDAIRRRRTQARLPPDDPVPEPSAEQRLMDETNVIPDERLRLIFVCCHPAVAAESRAALTLRLVCGLSIEEIARAFLVSEAALAQRLTRAKRKIADTGVPFAVPGPDAWSERLDAVLSTLEIAYAKAHEDAAGEGRHANYASEVLALTRVLGELVEDDADVFALAASVRFAEARRPARVDASGVMVPLSEQDPAKWDRKLIADGNAWQQRAIACGTVTPRVVQAQIHRAWCARDSLASPPPWHDILALYDMLLAQRDDPIVRLNRIVALAEVEGPGTALASLEELDAASLESFLPFHVVHADLLRRAGRGTEAIAAYERALSLGPAPAERRWLRARCDEVRGAPSKA